MHYFAFRAESVRHLRIREGWKAELAYSTIAASQQSAKDRYDVVPGWLLKTCAFLYTPGVYTKDTETASCLASVSVHSSLR